MAYDLLASLKDITEPLTAEQAAVLMGEAQFLLAQANNALAQHIRTKGIHYRGGLALADLSGRLEQAIAWLSTIERNS
jgi:hypothetical protein